MEKKPSFNKNKRMHKPNLTKILVPTLLSYIPKLVLKSVAAGSFQKYVAKLFVPHPHRDNSTSKQKLVASSSRKSLTDSGERSRQDRFASSILFVDISGITIFPYFNLNK